MRAFAVIPAAGVSRRLGRNKLLEPIAGEPLLARVIRAWQEGGVERCVVVCSPADPQAAEVARKAAAEVVQPQDSPPEMIDSIRLGLAFLSQTASPADSDVWLTAPADLPDLSSRVIARLLAEARQGQVDDAILAPVHGGRRGHPLLIAWRLAGEVMRLVQGESLRTLLVRYAVREIDCGGESLPRDLDTPEDLSAWQNQAGGR